jgi:hypothetical protein
MADFSIKQAAFTGYRIAKEKPGMLVVLALFSFIISSVGMWAIISTVGPTMAEMAAMRDDPSNADPAAAMRMLGALPILLGIGGVIAALSYMVSAGAVARAVIRPSTSKPPYIGLGADEFRLLMVGLVVGLILMVIFIAGYIVVGIATTAVAVSTGGLEGMARPGEMPPAVAAVTYGGAVVLYILIFLFSVRFSLAPAQSEREEAIRIFGSWGLTKGRYWPIVGAYLLGLLTLVPFGAVGFGLVVAVAMATGGTVSDAAGAFQPTMSEVSEMFTPLALTASIVNAIVGALGWMVCLGSSASVYAQVEGIATTEHNDDDDDDDDDD